MSFAQTQQGIVKTRGRMVNGKVVAGTRLNGATITLNFGNPLVSGKDGAFSFNVPSGKSYSLVTAKKQGYTLADPEYTRRSFKYSASNPFYVVLEDEAQRQADINAATRKVRRTLTAQLQAREDEIEALKEQDRITEQEYQAKLKELYDNQSQSEKLVKEMAERYVSTDYDQLDEFNRQVQMLIEEGELQKADSMIRSKGDIDKRVAEYHNVVAANKKVREELEQSEAGAAKTYEDLSQDLYNKHTIAMQQYQWDDALMHLKQRADLDTTNVQNVWDYAQFCYEQKFYQDSEKYYLLCLRTVETISPSDKIGLFHNIGGLYSDMKKWEDSEKYLKYALELLDLFSQSEIEEYIPKLAYVLNSLGAYYYDSGDFKKSKEFYDKSLNLYDSLFINNSDLYRYDYAGLLYNLGNLYNTFNDNISAEKYLLKSLEQWEILYSKFPTLNHRQWLATCIRSIGIMYSNDYKKSMIYYKQALSHYEELFKLNPSVYRENVAQTLYSISKTYRWLGDYEASEEYGKKAIEHFRILYTYDPQTYKNGLASTLEAIGNMWIDNLQYKKSEDVLKEALTYYEELYIDNPIVYQPTLACIYESLGLLYMNMKNGEEAVKYHTRALNLYEALFIKSPNIYKKHMATTHQNLGAAYVIVPDYDKAEKHIKIAMEHMKDLYALDSLGYCENYASCIRELGILYMKTREYDKGIDIFKKSIKYFEKIYDMNRFRYGRYILENLRGLGYIYTKKNDAQGCEETSLCEIGYLEDQKADAENIEKIIIIRQELIKNYTSKRQNDKAVVQVERIIKNFEKMIELGADEYNVKLASTKGLLGTLYYDDSHFEEAYNCFKESNTIIETTESSEDNRELLSDNLVQSAFCLYHINSQEFDKILDILKKAIELNPKNVMAYDFRRQLFEMQEKQLEASLDKERMYMLNSNTKSVDLANIQNKIGILYFNNHDYENAVLYYKQAQEKYEQLYCQYPETHRQGLAGVYWNTMLLYANTEKIDLYDDYLKKALNIYNILYKQDPPRYLSYIIELKNRTVWRMLNKGSIDDALTLALETYTIDESNLQTISYLASCYNSKAYALAKVSDYDYSISIIEKAISLVPTDPNFYDSKGEFFLLQGKNEEALAMWKKVLELNPKFLDDYPDGTNLSNGLKKLGLIE